MTGEAGLFDVVRLNTVGNALRNIAREMSINLRRCAHSVIIREGKDYVTGILDRNGQLVAQAEHNPVMVNSLLLSFQGCLQEIRQEEIEPEDILITNDPYAGGQHLPDIIIFAPVFFEGEVVAYVGNSAHHVDLGGGSAGPYSQATEIFQEGLRIPPGKINIRRDLNGGMFERLLMANVRARDQVRGDLEAQLAANSVGTRRMIDLFRRYGKRELINYIEKLIENSEIRTREAIEKIPDGTYAFVDCVDDDGLGTESITIHVTVEVKGSDLFIDFEGTSPQVRGFINSPRASTVAGIYTAVRDVLLDPTIFMNEGCNKPIHIKLPYGSVVDPKPPAPVRGRLCVGGRIVDAVLGAFSKAIPERSAADAYNVCTLLSFSRLRDDPEGGDTHKIILEVVGSGFGAAYGYDGESGIEAPIENCSNTPVEALEIDAEFLRIRAYSLRKDSGGAGKWRGGTGLHREFEILEDGTCFSAYADRFQHRPWGLLGGEPGQTGRFRLISNDQETSLGSKVNLVLNKGDILIVETGGGGGYGPPLERDPDLVHADVENGLISEEGAGRDYAIAGDLPQKSPLRST
jgi:N-methylhydantoinase B